MSGVQKSVAIHQPNFLPWLGYFFKVLRADIFVFLDDVQIELASQQAFVNRVRTYAGGKVDWLTCPISRSNSDSRRIKDIVFDVRRDWRKKVKKTLYFGYKKARFFEETYPWLEGLLDTPHENLSDYNMMLVEQICRRLGIYTEFYRSSALSVGLVGRSERLVQICGHLDASRYLSGRGGMKYHELAAFSEAGIEIVDLSFAHPRYSQYHGEFEAGLSVVDALFNCGIAGTAELLMGPVEPDGIVGGA